MRCAGASARVLLGVWGALACAGAAAAARYGEYGAPLVPQYGELLPAARAEYGERSPDAPAALDYKYEEDPQAKSDNLPMIDIDDERIWNKADYKKRKPPISRDNDNFDLDKDNLDEIESDLKSSRRLNKQRSNIQNKKNAKRRHFKYDNIDNAEIRSDYVQTEDTQKAEAIDIEENDNFTPMSTSKKKLRRKPRDRIIPKSERRHRNKNVRLEEEEVDEVADNNNYGSKDSRRSDGINEREDIGKTNKHNYDYDEYYDMKRVQNIRNRLPVVLRQTTVRTSQAEDTSASERRWTGRERPALLTGRAPLAPLALAPTRTREISSTTPASTATDLREIASPPERPEPTGNSSEPSLAEKSRLSILKKAQRKEAPAAEAALTKPPVLMQVTSEMRTVVMVEPHALASQPESPERLRRARRLMRQKLVAEARSLRELTDDWDAMVCDYIDVSLLAAAPRRCPHAPLSPPLLLLLVPLFLCN